MEIQTGWTGETYEFEVSAVVDESSPNSLMVGLSDNTWWNVKRSSYLIFKIGKTEHHFEEADTGLILRMVEVCSHNETNPFTTIH